MSRKLLFILTVTLAALLATGWPVARPPASKSYGEAMIGGHFLLTDTLGKPVMSEDFAGRLMLIYFGYTHCPDICPATLAMLSDVLKKSGNDSGKMAVVFITLDPHQDSPDALKKYLTSFDPRIIGLTGSEEEIKAVITSYKAYAAPTGNGAPGNMLISHSGLLYLMDGNGKYLQHFESGVKADTVLQAVRAQF